jgi:carbon monoxide dehydrogenase subunit G
VKLDTTPKIINASQEEVFNFLMDMNNFQELFPKDKVEKWEATQESCSCKVKNMGTIELKRVASTPNSLIYLDSYGKTPFKFNLNLFLKESEDSKCLAHIEFDGEINPFMKMMLEKPLTDFFNKLVFRLSEKYA